MKISSEDILLLLQEVGLRTKAKDKKTAYRALFAAVGFAQLLVKDYPVTDLDEEYGSVIVYQFILNKIGRSSVEEAQRGIICSELCRIGGVLRCIISNLAKDQRNQ